MKEGVKKPKEKEKKYLLKTVKTQYKRNSTTKRKHKKILKMKNK